MITRRRLLLGGAIVSTLGIYSHQRGLRYPPLSFEQERLPVSVLSSDLFEFVLQDCIATSNLTLRATTPEPRVHIQRMSDSTSIRVSNLATNAVLTISGSSSAQVDEEVDGTSRTLHITKADPGTTLKWSLPVENGFEFAVMGDTGGGSELAWTIARAHELGAQFLLHLGDINYTQGEYEMAIEHFNKAKLPCYVTIGNHDFHTDGLIYEKFISEIGPMNHAFDLAGTRFINLDTAVDFWPADRGQRGALLAGLMNAGSFNGDQIIFTHRPLKDPQPHDDHEIHGPGEVNWLVQQCHNLGIDTFLSGHVHHSAEIDFNGIRQFTIGEGLGYEDLVSQKPVAKMLLGKVEPFKKVKYRWEDLNMPWSEHQNPTHRPKLVFDGLHEQLKWYENLRKGSN